MSSLGERQADFQWRLLSTGDGRAIQQRNQMSAENAASVMHALKVFGELAPEAKRAVVSILIKREVADNGDD
jgi:hypothetical protein